MYYTDDGVNFPIGFYENILKHLNSCLQHDDTDLDAPSFDLVLIPPSEDLKGPSVENPEGRKTSQASEEQKASSIEEGKKSPIVVES